MYPTQLHSYLLWRSSVEPNPQQLAGKRYTAAASVVPAIMCGIFTFGWYASVVLLNCLFGAFIADVLGRRVIYRREKELFLKRDGVWLLTGLLVGLMLPPAIPWYWAMTGSFVAVLAGKYLLQVDGTPLFQPALLGLLALHILCPLVTAVGSGTPPAPNPMNPRSNWPVLDRVSNLEAPAEGNVVWPMIKNFFGGDIRITMPRHRSHDLFKVSTAEALTGPRPQDLVAEMPSRDLSRQTGATREVNESYDWLKMLLGYLPGTIGASSGMALLMGIFLLVFSRTLSPLVPLSALLTLLTGLYLAGWLFGQGAEARVMYGNIPIHLLSGGTLLGMFYFAADPAISPRSKAGKVYAGIFFGLMELIFRVGFRWSDGLPLTILLTQSMSFVIDQWLAPPRASSASSVHIGISQSSLGRL